MMIETVGIFVADQIVRHGVVATLLAVIALDLRNSLLICLRDNSRALNRLLALLDDEPDD